MNSRDIDMDDLDIDVKTIDAYIDDMDEHHLWM